jgi:hypothetical protein
MGLAGTLALPALRGKSFEDIEYGLGGDGVGVVPVGGGLRHGLRASEEE